MSDLSKAKKQMLKEHLEDRGITNQSVLNAFKEVPREEFIPDLIRKIAYEDRPLGIGEGQTISQPYVVAFMTQLLEPNPSDVILEIGTGSGYQAAILSRICRKVYSIERFENLAQKAERLLRELGYNNIEVIVGDGSKGLPSEAPFEGIIVTAGSPAVPEPLTRQLKVGGRLVIPVGTRLQEMTKITKTEEGLDKETFPGFRFVPLVGEFGFKD